MVSSTGRRVGPHGCPPLTPSPLPLSPKTQSYEDEVSSYSIRQRSRLHRHLPLCLSAPIPPSLTQAPRPPPSPQSPTSLPPQPPYHQHTSTTNTTSSSFSVLPSPLHPQTPTSNSMRGRMMNEQTASRTSVQVCV